LRTDDREDFLIEEKAFLLFILRCFFLRGKPSDKKDQKMRTEVLCAKQKVQSKSSGMKQGFLSQKTLF
jgi:hypothetical protein